MQNILPAELKKLAAACPFKLYVVGGAVRDHIAGLTPKVRDWDICAPALAEAMSAVALSCGWQIAASFPATGSLKLHRGGVDCEFTSFRTDSYGEDGHAPSSVTFTDDIALDARRRDFTCNAVYYDIQSGEIVDPLGGVGHIRAKLIVPCSPPQRLFAEDGVRILRLARFCGELGFEPSAECIRAAGETVQGLSSISPSWLWREFSGILAADEKYSLPGGCGRGLKVAHQTGALKVLFPALYACGGAARAIAAAGGAQSCVRLAALLYCLGADGAKATIAPYPLKKSQLTLCTGLIEAVHSAPKEGEELRLFIQRNACNLAQMCALAAAVGVDGNVWLREYDKMRAEGVPFTLGELSIRGDDLLAAGILSKHIGKILNYLLESCACNPTLNKKNTLISLAKSICGDKE